MMLSIQRSYRQALNAPAICSILQDLLRTLNSTFQFQAKKIVGFGFYPTNRYFVGFGFIPWLPNPNKITVGGIKSKPNKNHTTPSGMFYSVQTTISIYLYSLNSRLIVISSIELRISTLSL